MWPRVLRAWPLPSVAPGRCPSSPGVSEARLHLMGEEVGGQDDLDPSTKEP